MKKVLKNSLVFENGIVHELTSSEILVLQVAIKNCLLSAPTPEHEEALFNLKSLFLDQLD